MEPAKDSASDWYRPSHGWSSILLSACLGGALTWLALAARGKVEPHTGWRQSVRALASTRGSCTAQPWPSRLRYVCVRSQGLGIRVYVQIWCFRVHKHTPSPGHAERMSVDTELHGKYPF